MLKKIVIGYRLRLMKKKIYKVDPKYIPLVLTRVFSDPMENCVPTDVDLNRAVCIPTDVMVWVPADIIGGESVWHPTCWKGR